MERLLFRSCWSGGETPALRTRWGWGVFSCASRPVLHSFVRHHWLNNYTWEGQVMGRIHAITAPRQNTHLSLSRRASLIGVIGGTVGWRLGVFGWLSYWSLWQRSRQGRASGTVLTTVGRRWARVQPKVAGNNTVTWGHNSNMSKLLWLQLNEVIHASVSLSKLALQGIFTSQRVSFISLHVLMFAAVTNEEISHVSFKKQVK